MTNKLQISTDVPDEIHMTRVFNAPKRLVIKAMTTPELVKKWLGGKRAEMAKVEFDARVGGKYLFVFKMPGGGGFQFSGDIEELSEDRIVYTERFNDMPEPAHVTATYVEENGKTTMRVVVRYPSPEIRDMVLKTGMTEGAGETYDYLENLLTTL